MNLEDDFRRVAASGELAAWRRAQGATVTAWLDRYAADNSTSARHAKNAFVNKLRRGDLHVIRGRVLTPQ